MAVEVKDAYLVARAQEGHLDAFEQLLHRHNLAAYRVALRMLGDDEDAQEVAREALVLAWQTLSQFTGNTSFVIWLYTVVTRATLDRLARGRSARTAQSHPTADEVAGGPSDIASAITALPPAQRIVLVLHHFEGLPYTDVATITGSTVPDTRRLLFRGRRTLAATLGQWEVAAQ